MACPCFIPEIRVRAEGRFPLGDAHLGQCGADSKETYSPPEDRQLELCNRGYARGPCERFPAQVVADAYRFSVVEDRGETVRVVWVAEREHSPVEHGVMEFVERIGLAPGADPLTAQAQAFAEGYLRRRGVSKVSG